MTSASTHRLIEAVQRLSLARDLDAIAAIVRVAARELTGADGATFVLREGDYCHYADENAIAPLWKGQRFPMDTCVSGWAMHHRQSAVIPDIYEDPRVPADAYRPTFVRSLAMVPIRTQDPIGAIGNYWARRYVPGAEELALLEALANTTAVALENVRVYAELEQRVEARTRELDQANRELEAFSYSISHDLRAPLRAVHGYCRIFLEDFGAQVPDEGREVIGKAVAGAERMRELIDDLLEFARFSRQPLQHRAVDLDAIVARVVEAERARPGAHAVTVQAGTLGHCDGDPSLLEQVFVNLVGNAFKFTRHAAAPRVEIGTEEIDGERVWFVRDNGAGFDMQYAGRLFEVFHRLHGEREFEGTGVGLSIVHRIVQRHRGRIWAEAEPGRGAIFRFTLACA